MSSKERKEAKDAFRLLKAELGDNFLQEASRQKHPFFDTHHNKNAFLSGTNYSYIGTVRNTAPWTRRWIAWLATALKKIKYQNNYSALLKRIKNRNQYIEALSVLDTAYKLANVEFAVSFEPEIIVHQGMKNLILK